MPALRPVPPDVFRQVLESKGWNLIAEDEHNWVFAKDVDDFPIVLPRRVKLLAVDVMMHAMDQAELPDGECLAILTTLGYAYPVEPFSVIDSEPPAS